MMTLEIDDETASVLSDLAQQQHLNPGQIVKAALLDYIEDRLDSQRAELAYQRYLDSGKVTHNFDDAVKALGLDN